MIKRHYQSIELVAEVGLSSAANEGGADGADLRLSRSVSQFDSADPTPLEPFEAVLICE